MSTAYAGYTGRVMLVNLSDETVREYPWSDAERKQYLGGKPMAYKLLCDHLTGKEHAFSEENWIIISTGPLTLTGAPSSSRYDITTISPLTNTPVSSNCGGEFGLWLKRAGFDALILAGRCSTPHWLEIRDDQFIFHDAAGLWGTYCDDCREQLGCLMGNRQHGSVYIGPAGEMADFSATVTDGTHTCGRKGFGAVFGWKNLKAITVTGTSPLPLRDPQRAAALSKKWFRKLYEHPLAGKADQSNAHNSCAGCPISCPQQSKTETAPFDRLGVDAGSARHRHGGFAALLWGWGLEMSSMPDRLQLDCMLLYLDLCEAISAAGLCVFTVNAFCPKPMRTKPYLFTRWLIPRIVRKPELLCIPLPLFWQTKLLRAVAGLKLTPGQFIGIGSKCFALEQQLTLRFGGNAEALPKLLTKESACTPGEYFAARGWTKDGIPPMQ